MSSWETLEESGSVVLVKMTIIVSGGWLWSIAALWQMQEFAQSISLGMFCRPWVNIHIVQRRWLWWMGQVWIDFWRPNLLQWRKSCRCGCVCEKTDAFLLCCGCALFLLLVKGKSNSEVKGAKEIPNSKISGQLGWPCLYPLLCRQDKWKLKSVQVQSRNTAEEKQVWAWPWRDFWSSVVLQWT